MKFSDDSDLVVKGKGIVEIQTLNGNNMFIDGTFLTPTFKNNILFVGKMMDEQFSMPT